MNRTLIAVTTTYPELKTQAKQLAADLKLEYCEDLQDNIHYFLILTPSHLGLQKNQSRTKPLIVDFSSSYLQHRRKQATLKKELLARALGVKANSTLTIVDATAGLGKDSFILASLGLSVILLERSNIAYSLIEDALKRAEKQPELTEIIRKMTLIHTDSIEWLQSQKSIDIIYLDPMFPESKKTALSKHDMRVFQEVVGNDQDSGELLHAALACASKRVVVKRPRLALPLASLMPSFSMKGSSSRFDIYLT